MVDLIASNQKLKQRSRNILRQLSKNSRDWTDEALNELLARCDGSVKLALVVAETGLSVEESRRQLEAAHGVLAGLLPVGDDDAQPETPPVTRAKQRYQVLCIDGGGSKCAAVVGTAGGVMSRGVGGPCNLYVAVLRTPSGKLHAASCSLAQLTIDHLQHGWTV